MSFKTDPFGIDAPFRALCESFDTPRSLAVWLLFFNKEHEQLSQLSIDPLDYLECHAENFRNDYLVTEYLSKYKGLVTGVDTARVAYASFSACEDQCREANIRIRNFWTDGGSPQLSSIICRAQDKIQKSIGAHPSFAKLIDRFRWGPGATSTLKGLDARIDYKLREEQISVTLKARPYLRAAIATDYAWLRARGIEAVGPVSLCNSEFRVVQGSRGLTVPKNAKTDRFIAAEPTGNSFLQLGVGNYFRQCLRRVGVDLDDQSINQVLAAQALHLGLATVDLKSASDTISSAAVWQLLPYSWASFLENLRSPKIQIEGSWVSLEKFSSMGNGFTFELESLIFWALTESTRDELGSTGRVSVYGDDIICPSEVVSTLRTVLEFFGFSFNMKKTHTSSLFRESCGKHYFGGQDVTPIYQKEDPFTHESEAYRFHNRLLYHAVDRGWTTSESSAIVDRKLLAVVRTARKAVYSFLTARRRACVIPVVLNRELRTLDGGLVTSGHQKEFIFHFQPGCGSSGKWSARALVFVPEPVTCHESALFAVMLKTMTAREPGSLGHEAFEGFINLRNHGRWRLRRRFFPESGDLHW